MVLDKIFVRFFVSRLWLEETCYYFWSKKKIISAFDTEKEDILVPGESPTQGMNNNRIAAEAKNSIKFSKSNRQSCLSLHCNGSNSFLFVNVEKIYQFKAKDSEIRKYIPGFE